MSDSLHVCKRPFRRIYRQQDAQTAPALRAAPPLQEITKLKKQKPGRQDPETPNSTPNGKKGDMSRVEPIHATLPKLRPPSHNATKNKVTATFNFEEDFQHGDDSMDGSLLSGDSHNNFHGCDSPDTGFYWPVQLPSLWPAKGWIPHAERSEDIQVWILSVQERNSSQNKFQPATERRPLLVHTVNQDKADLYSNVSSHNDYSGSSDNTTLPVIEFDDNDCDTALETDISPVLVRQGSVELGTTSQFNRSCNQLGNQFVSATVGSPIVMWQRPTTIHNFEKTEPVQRVLPEPQLRLVQQTQQPRCQIRAEVEKPSIGNSQLSPLLFTGPNSDESTELDGLLVDVNESEHSIESDSSVKHSISDAILNLHQSMSKPFWTNDERWLVSVTRPASRSYVFSPTCDEIIRCATELIQVIEWIKSKETYLERSSFAAAMNRRICDSVRKIRVSCNKICQNIFDMGRKDSTAMTSCYNQTLKRMRECLIPRLVVVLAKTFTLLANPGQMMRRISMSLMEDICFDMQRIVDIIKSGAENSESNSSESRADIKEFIHLLSVVRDWVKTETDQIAE